MVTLNERIGNKIKMLRVEKGLTQKDFGELFSISQNRVTNIETGKSILTYDELLKMAEYFEVTTDYIIKENGVKFTNPEKQFICDYTGLNESVIDKLHQICFADNDEFFDNDDYKISELELTKTKKTLNDFISSSTFDDIIGNLEIINFINEEFVSLLSLFFGDYDYFAKIRNLDIFGDTVESQMLSICHEIKHQETNHLGNKLDLTNFKSQKSLQTYSDSISLLTTLSDKKLKNSFNACVYFFFSCLSKENITEKNAKNFFEDYRNNETYFIEFCENLKPIYDEIKTKYKEI